MSINIGVSKQSPIYTVDDFKSKILLKCSLMKLTKSGNYVIRASFSGHSAGGFYNSAGLIFSFF